MAYVIQDRTEDNYWDERPERFSTLEAAIRHTYPNKPAQIIRIPEGVIVWHS